MSKPLRHAVIASAALALVAAATISSPAGAIHRGYDARITSFPFMVSLRLAELPDRHRCGGTLIAADIVLTAAHCVARIPDGGLVAVVGVDVAAWPTAPRVATLAHRVPGSYEPRRGRDDIAVVRLAAPQATPGVRLGGREPRVGARVVTAGWGCTSAPPDCSARPHRLQASSQTVLPDRACGLDVFWNPPTNPRSNICTKGARPRSTVNHGDSGGPLLIRDRSGAFRQVGVTALGADSATKLYAGFTSIPRERGWVAGAIKALRGG